MTEDGDCSHESKRHLLLERKVMTNLGSIIQSRDITLPTKVHLVKAMVFLAVMYGFESWTIKKAEHVELMLLKSDVGEDSWESIGQQGDPTSPSDETPILWPSDAKNWLIWKDPDAGKDWRWEEKGTTEDEMVGWHHRFNGHEFWVNSRRWWWTGKPGVLQSMRSQSQTQLSNWTVLNWML